MKISYREFHAQLLGARLCDEGRWTKLNQEACLWGMWAFGDDGVHYVPSSHRRESDWGDVTKMPGYYEPEGFVIQ